MKLGFYPRLAWSGIRKNKRLFVPYILAAAGTAAVFYIMFYLASGDLLDGMRGGMTAQSTLSLGVFVIVAFALLFLFYCNSFLVRRRYKEFGLYSILGMNRKNILDFRQLSMSGVFENGVFDISERFSGSSDIIDYGKITNLRIVSLSDYNRISGKSETLAGNEVLLHALRTDYGLKTISLGSVETFTVKKTLDTMPLADGSGAEISPTITLVVSDFDNTAERLVDGAGEYVVRLKWICDFDCSDELEDQDKVCNMIAAASENGKFSDKDGSSGWQYLSYESRAAEYADFAAVYGGLFFLGVTLSLVFICAAVLIIYYKQLSEGYEDAQRFEIMQKVGMTKQEIRRSINSQLLTVFFLPLIFAGLHLAFAFPFIRKILYMFSFYNTSFLVWTTVISFFVFAVLYALVYKKTSNTYYKIVS